MRVDEEPIPLTVLVAGWFGVGRTPLVRTLSEIPPVILYLFGAPGRSRFWFMWDEHRPEDVRDALGPDVPLVWPDARDPGSGRPLSGAGGWPPTRPGPG